jgi:hypothetical protein
MLSGISVLWPGSAERGVAEADHAHAARWVTTIPG